MNVKLLWLLLIVGIVLVSGCTGGGGLQPNASTNATAQPQGGQQGGGAGTGQPSGGTSLKCTEPKGALPIGQEYYACTSNQKGFGVTLESVAAGIFCDDTNFGLQAKVVTRIELTGKGYYDYYAFYPEWGSVITDNLGNSYYPFIECNDDMINPKAKDHDWVKIGDAANTPCVNNCELRGGVYFELLDPAATEFNLQVFGFNYTFTKAEVEWLNDADKGFVAAQFKGCRDVARDCPGEYCSSHCITACEDKNERDIMDGTSFDMSGEASGICSGENDTSACYYCMNGEVDKIVQA
jgi:hypothetical protein